MGTRVTDDELAARVVQRLSNSTGRLILAVGVAASSVPFGRIARAAAESGLDYGWLFSTLS